MLIDDDPSVLESFKLWLEDEGYTLYTAATKAAALEVLKKHSISVCLIDLKIKGEDGLKVSEELKRIDSLLKIIIITGYPSYESAIDAMKLGVFDYVSKFSENDEILDKIEEAISSRQKTIEDKEKAVGERNSIVLVCNHAMIREGFVNFCRKHRAYQLMHTYHSVDYIKSGDFNKSADLVLVCQTCNQHCFTDSEGTFSRLHYLFPNARLVMINYTSDDESKKKLIKLGVRGFFPKNIFTENMAKAFKEILEGQHWVSRRVAYSLLNELLAKDDPSEFRRTPDPYELSSREIEILQAIATGMTNFEISTKLFISEKTVKVHINHIFKKMGVKSRTQAVKKAVEERLI